MVHLPQLLPWLKDLCMEVGIYTIYYKICDEYVEANAIHALSYLKKHTLRVANNLPLLFSSGPPTVSRILVKFCTAVLQAISAFPVNTIETSEPYYTNRTRIDVYMYIPCVAACSLGHSGSNRSCCACSSNIGSLHKRTDNLS